MTEIIKHPGCGNSPKSKTLEDFAIAVAIADDYLITQLVTDDVIWRPVGNKDVSGSAIVCKGLARYGEATSITIEHSITHGKSGAVNGIVEFGRKKRAFCLVIEFASARGNKIREITSYSIPLT